MSKQLILEFQNELKQFISRKVKNSDDVNDILQDVLLKIHINYSKIRKKESLKSWLYQITRNTIIDYYLKKKKLTVIISDTIIYDFEDYSEDKSEIVDCLQPFIAQLPNKYKEALLQTDLGKLSQKEFAEKTGLSYSGAKSVVQRARAKLKKLFEQCCQIEVDIYGNILEYQKNKSCPCS
ncbi:MAG: RNA polymerase sigma factor SigZ [Bacteroidia bacterium]|nr:RNA polymerase sigma factor SigZ [Bacteroidia bacterium]